MASEEPTPARGAPIGHRRKPMSEERIARRRDGKTMERLHQARLAVGIGQKAAAKAAGIAIRTYQKYESGELPVPPADVLMRLAIAFGVNLESLLDMNRPVTKKKS
jgi:hypothetical protein